MFVEVRVMAVGVPDPFCRLVVSPSWLWSGVRRCLQTGEGYVVRVVAAVGASCKQNAFTKVTSVF